MSDQGVVKILSSTELSCHNFIVGVPSLNSEIGKLILIEEWELRAAIHFVARVQEATKRARERLVRDLAEKEKKK